MSKYAPHLLVMIFAMIITLRTGYVIYEYQGDSFKASATETKPQEVILENKIIKNTPLTSNKLETVSDKILKIDSNNAEINPYASQIASKEVDNIDKTCITGIMLEDALEKLEYLEKREAQILEQQKLLEVSDRRIREQVAKLKLIKNEIVESAKLADSTIARENKRLISIYEKMKPKDAANIFNEMSPVVAAELLRTMKEDQSSQILSKMNPKNAYNVTLSLSGGIKETEKKYDNIRKDVH